jgi:hypothetical protein
MEKGDDALSQCMRVLEGPRMVPNRCTLCNQVASSHHLRLSSLNQTNPVKTGKYRLVLETDRNRFKPRMPRVRPKNSSTYVFLHGNGEMLLRRVP